MAEEKGMTREFDLEDGTKARVELYPKGETWAYNLFLDGVPSAHCGTDNPPNPDSIESAVRRAYSALINSRK